MKPLIGALALVLLTACTADSMDKNLACRATILDYAHHFDLGIPADAAALFTENAVWELATTRLQGRKAINAYFEQLGQREHRLSRHVLGNTRLEWLSPDTARGTVYLTLYTGTLDPAAGVATLENQPFVVGHYADEYRWQDGRCLISKRQVVPAFVHSSAG